MIRRCALCHLPWSRCKGHGRLDVPMMPLARLSDDEFQRMLAGAPEGDREALIQQRQISIDKEKI